MPARGKHGKPRTGFPPFPPSLEISQKRRDSHIPTASTTTYICQPRPDGPAENRQQRGWAKLNCRSGPNSVAKRREGSEANLLGISAAVHSARRDNSELSKA